jgi:hypothetical protein
MIAATWGCAPEGAPRGGIHGRVTVGGKPLTRGRILFLPQNPPGPVVSAMIQDGAYQLHAEEGPLVGHNRVEVEAELDLGFPIDDEQAFAQRRAAPLPPNPIPPRFNRQSTLAIEIQEGDNTYDVTIPPSKQ